jgi:hypothetical protein
MFWLRANQIILLMLHTRWRLLQAAVLLRVVVLPPDNTYSDFLEASTESTRKGVFDTPLMLFTLTPDKTVKRSRFFNVGGVE